MILRVRGTPASRRSCVVARPFAALLAAALAFLVSGSHANVSAAPKWHVVRGEYFDIYSEAGAAAAIETAVWLEQFRRSVGTVWKLDPKSLNRVRVVQFRSKRSFEPYSRGKYMGGYFQRSELLCTMAFFQSGEDAWTRQLVQHECVHWMLASASDRFPTWLEEGMAELYATFSIAGNECKLFLADPGSVVWLQQNGVKSLASVVATDNDSIDFNERNMVEAFYAQAWVLTHYMLCSSKVEDGSEKLIRYTELLARGGHPIESLEQALGADIAEIEKELQRYAHTGRHHILKMKFPRDELRRQFQAEPAPDIEVECALAALEICGPQNLDGAELRFLAARRRAPESPLPYEGLGTIALMRGDRRAAVKHFGQAAQRESRHAYAYYLPAVQELRDRLGYSPEDYHLRAEDAGRLATALFRALELDPSLADAPQELALALLFSEPLKKSEVQRIANMVRSAEDPLALRYRLAGLLHRLGDTRARSLLENLARIADYEMLKSAAEADLTLLDRLGGEARVGARPVFRPAKEAIRVDSLRVPTN